LASQSAPWCLPPALAARAIPPPLTNPRHPTQPPLHPPPQFPYSARHGLDGEFDATWLLIKTLEFFGLAWDVQVRAPLPRRTGVGRPGQRAHSKRATLARRGAPAFGPAPPSCSPGLAHRFPAPPPPPLPQVPSERVRAKFRKEKDTPVLTWAPTSEAAREANAALRLAATADSDNAAAAAPAGRVTRRSGRKA
jgi:hypothetical protein